MFVSSGMIKRLIRRLVGTDELLDRILSLETKTRSLEEHIRTMERMYQEDYRFLSSRVSDLEGHEIEDEEEYEEEEQKEND